MPKNKTISLDGRVVLASNPKSIFEIVQWLHLRVFSKGVRDGEQLNQIIFQLMLSFYRYDDANTMLNSPKMITEFGLNVEKLEMILIDHITKQLQGQEIGKISTAVQQQIKMLKQSSIQGQAIKAMYHLLTMLADNGINPTPSQK